MTKIFNIRICLSHSDTDHYFSPSYRWVPGVQAEQGGPPGLHSCPPDPIFYYQQSPLKTICPSISQISYLLVASKKGGLGRSVRVNWVGGRLLAALGDKLDRAHVLQHCLAFFPFYSFHTLKVDRWSMINIYNIGLSILFRRRKV